MTRDWHATYLTCPTVADAAARRCAQTGEDGWAAAATLARTMPPGFGHHEAAGARAVIAPCSEPDHQETAHLKAASQVGSEGADWWLIPSDGRSVSFDAFLSAYGVTAGGTSLWRAMAPQLDEPSQRAMDMACIAPPEVPSFTCPHCGATSYSPDDIRENYCGRCHDRTGILAAFNDAVDQRRVALGVDPAGEPVSVLLVHELSADRAGPGRTAATG